MRKTMRKTVKKKQEILERFCYVKVKVDEMEVEKSQLQKEIMSWPDRPDKKGIEVLPYGTLCYRSRENWSVLDIPMVFKKIGKDTFLDICGVPIGKLKKAIGTIGFKKLKALKIIQQETDSEYFLLKKSPAINGALGKNK